MELYKSKLFVTHPRYYHQLISNSWKFQAVLLQANGFAHSPGSLAGLLPLATRYRLVSRSSWAIQPGCPGQTFRRWEAP
jgi:hypothetical protein